jgi:hypothetical protein
MARLNVYGGGTYDKPDDLDRNNGVTKFTATPAPHLVTRVTTMMMTRPKDVAVDINQWWCMRTSRESLSRPYCWKVIDKLCKYHVTVRGTSIAL